MEAMPNDLERIFFFEHARKDAEAVYARNPKDADNLTKWAGALLELSQFQSGPDSLKYIEDAILRLDEALVVNPKKADALWCLGTAHMSRGFYSNELDIANISFDKATDCFQKAVDEEPGNSLYVNSLENSVKAPELHQNLQKQLSQPAAAAGGPSVSSMHASKKKKSSDLTYDILGWVILAAGIVAWMGMAKSHGPPVPPR